MTCISGPRGKDKTKKDRCMDQEREGRGVKRKGARQRVDKERGGRDSERVGIEKEERVREGD